MKATDIKNELKELGYNVKDFKISVKHRGCADIYINVTVKNIMLNLNEIDSILKEKYESIDYDELTCEILQGGNIFVLVEYDEEVMYQAIKQRKADAQKILDNLDKFECEAGYGKIFYEDKKLKSTSSLMKESCHFTKEMNKSASAFQTPTTWQKP